MRRKQINKTKSQQWAEDVINGKEKVPDTVEMYFESKWICRTTPNGIEINGNVPLRDKIKSIPIMIKYYFDKSMNYLADTLGPTDHSSGE